MTIKGSGRNRYSKLERMGDLGEGLDDFPCRDYLNTERGKVKATREED